MLAFWDNVNENFNTRPLRERAIISVLAIVITWGLFKVFLISDINKKTAALSQRMESAEMDIKKLTAQEMVLAKALDDDPNVHKKQQILALERRLSSLDKKLEALSVGLISAENLTIVLRDVVKSISTLTLVGMQTLESSELKIQGEQDEQDNLESSTFTSKQKEEDIGIFKHSVVVVLEGQYFDVVKYLAALEKLPWKIYWQEIDYEVIQYPQAKIMIEVYTLSTEHGVLGV
ncbi:hypothetical protein [Agarilytica rhodophyticola]|uniref:hypothetical protein n=1 Tax=Agarilytica rhodophyticola TaxID=1737490 RepID=UPI000B346C5F|nr:hypothetical protein [Agarilytica rhodophyticola]